MGDGMAVTLKDIAERVGKSVPTVSRALGDFDDISPKTRAEIQRVAREMGYEPNITARNLQKQRTDTLSLILPTPRALRFSDPFFSELLSGIVEYTATQGFELNISTTTPEEERESYLKHMRGRRVDGFIIVRTQRKDPRIDLLEEHNYPFVAFGRVDGVRDFHFVDEDGTHGIRQLVDHLVGLGHTRLACIAEPVSLTKSHLRVQGFLDGLAAHGLAFEPDLFVETNFRQKSGYLAGQKLLGLEHPPTAIIAVNDLLAIGAMSAIQEAGLGVGRDISVTGFDDILLAEYTNPPLTTVHLPASPFGALLAEMLIRLIKGEPIDEKQIIVKPEIVVRQSTGPCPS